MLYSTVMALGAVTPSWIHFSSAYFHHLSLWIKTNEWTADRIIQTRWLPSSRELPWPP